MKVDAIRITATETDTKTKLLAETLQGCVDNDIEYIAEECDSIDEYLYECFGGATTETFKRCGIEISIIN